MTRIRYTRLRTRGRPLFRREYIEAAPWEEFADVVGTGVAFAEGIGEAAALGTAAYFGYKRTRKAVADLFKSKKQKMSTVPIPASTMGDSVNGDVYVPSWMRLRKDGSYRYKRSKSSRRGKKKVKDLVKNLMPTFVFERMQHKYKEMCEWDKDMGRTLIGSIMHQNVIDEVNPANDRYAQYIAPCQLYELTLWPGTSNSTYTFNSVAAYTLIQVPSTTDISSTGNLSDGWRWRSRVLTINSPGGGDGPWGISENGSSLSTFGTKYWTYSSATISEAEALLRHKVYIRDANVDLTLYGQNRNKTHYRVDLVQFIDEDIMPGLADGDTELTPDGFAPDSNEGKKKMNLLAEYLTRRYVSHPGEEVDTTGAKYLKFLKTWTFDLAEGLHDAGDYTGVDQIPRVRTNIKIPINRMFNHPAMTQTLRNDKFANPEAEPGIDEPNVHTPAAVMPSIGNTGGQNWKMHPRRRLFLMVRATDYDMVHATGSLNSFTPTKGGLPSYDIKMEVNYITSSPHLASVGNW